MGGRSQSEEVAYITTSGSCFVCSRNLTMHQYRQPYQTELQVGVGVEEDRIASSTSMSSLNNALKCPLLLTVQSIPPYPISF